MKHQILVIATACLLAACTTPKQERTAPLDMNAVQAYNHKVASGNTVPNEQRVKYSKQVEMPLNKSDEQPKTTVGNGQPRVVLLPSIGYHYGYHRHHW